MSRLIKIIDVAELNRETFLKNEFPENINYLDTGSLTRNKIEGFQYLNTNIDKIPSRAQRKVKRNTILYSTVRPNQEHYGIFEKEIYNIVVSTGFTTIDIIDESINPKYLFYLLTQRNITEYLHTIGMNAVSSYPSISPGDIGNLKFKVPTLQTQKAIAKVLSNLDTKIELNNKINQELEVMAKTIYDYWFVQFDFPFDFAQGKPNEQGKPYKSSGGKMVYNEELKREIPEGWEVGTLKNISELIRGVSYSKNDIKKADDEGVIPILRATNITGNVIDLDNMVYVPNQFVSSNQLLNKYDILITMSSGSIEHIGKNGFFYFDKKVAFGAFCAKLVAKKNFQYYLYSYTQSDFMFATIKNECLGTNINNLNSSLVNGFKTIIPPEELIEKFNIQVKNIYDKIANNQKQNQQLTALRDWLLPMLMNGQVTVRQAQGGAISESEEKVCS